MCGSTRLWLLFNLRSEDITRCNKEVVALPVASKAGYGVLSRFYRRLYIVHPRKAYTLSVTFSDRERNLLVFCTVPDLGPVSKEDRPVSCSSD